MKIAHVINEVADNSSDYQNMLSFVKANQVAGVPPDQQIGLALFRELQKQKQQNQALGTELSAAEQRINQALSTGELSQKELGMHQAELERERRSGEEQQSAIGQLGQKYSERDRASREQMQGLTAKLEAVKNKPGVDKRTAEELEKQIKKLSQESVPVDRLQALEQTISAVQNMQQVDDSAIKDLMAQVKDAQAASEELQKTRQTVGRDAEETAQRALDQVEQIKQQLAHFREVEQTVAELQPRVNQIAMAQDLSNRIRNKVAAKNFKTAINKGEVPPELGQDTRQMAQTALTGPVTKPRPTAADPQMNSTDVAESQMRKAIEWATGKQS
jgi:DNA repair exonuclease SbcCD ATPase subunit